MNDRSNKKYRNTRKTLNLDKKDKDESVSGVSEPTSYTLSELSLVSVIIFLYSTVAENVLDGV